MSLDYEIMLEWVKEIVFLLWKRTGYVMDEKQHTEDERKKP